MAKKALVSLANHSCYKRLIHASSCERLVYEILLSLIEASTFYLGDNHGQKDKNLGSCDV